MTLPKKVSVIPQREYALLHTVYSKDGVFHQNLFLCQSRIMLNFIVTVITNKMFTTYV